MQLNKEGILEMKFNAVRLYFIFQYTMTSGENEEKKNQFYISVPSLVIVIVVLTVLCVGSGVLLGYYLKLSPQITNVAEFSKVIQVDDLESNKQKSCEKKDLKDNAEVMRQVILM